jgi:hypothetical protein
LNSAGAFTGSRDSGALPPPNALPSARGLFSALVDLTMDPPTMSLVCVHGEHFADAFDLN